MKKNGGVRSVREFLESIWRAPTLSNTELTLFRGQLNNDSLLPKLFRRNTPSQVQQAEHRMLEYLREAAPHLAPSIPKNEWDWLSLGQHYGMSTRMSDWTANPLVALFFAVELDSAADAYPLVYRYPVQPEIIERDKQTSPLTISHTRVTQPNHSHRSQVQAAWHVVHAIHLLGDGSYKFIPLADMPPHKDRITEIELNKDCVPKIRDELKQMGMTHSTIYGDFGSVCRSIGGLFGLA